MAAINLTFKNNQQERELYEWLMKKTNKSGYIKDLLLIEMEKEKSKNTKIMRGFLTFEE